MKQCPKHEWATSSLYFGKTLSVPEDPGFEVKTIVIEIEVCLHCSKVRNVK